MYRGVNNFSTLDYLEVNDCFIDKGYASTSKSEDVAIDFAGGRTSDKIVLFEINTQSGRIIYDISEDMKEEEVIILPETPLKLISIEKREKNFGYKVKTQKRFHFKEVKLNECDKNIYH